MSRIPKHILLIKIMIKHILLIKIMIKTQCRIDREREREKKRESHPQTVCFVVSQLFSVARHVGRLKLGSKPLR